MSFLTVDPIGRVLTGIDDAQVLLTVRTECLRRANTSWLIAGGALIGGVLGTIEGGVVAWLLGIRGTTGMVWLAICVTLNLCLIRYCAGLYALRFLPDILRSMGRCTNCGYSLSNGEMCRCPECGEAVSEEDASNVE